MKVLAAHRAGIKTVVLPQRNERDLIDVPDNVKKSMNFVYAQGVEDLVNYAFAQAKSAKPKAQVKPKFRSKAAAKAQG